MKKFFAIAPAVTAGRAKRSPTHRVLRSLAMAGSAVLLVFAAAGFATTGGNQVPASASLRHRVLAAERISANLSKTPIGPPAARVMAPAAAGSCDVLHCFAGSDGSEPNRLIQATDGSFYGTTYQGGANGYGTIFKMGTDGSTFTTLRSFAYGDGAYPQAGLIQGTDGSLYGTTYFGGANGYGTIFKMDTNGSTFTTLRSFAYSDGAYPQAGLIQGTDGSLYGTTKEGGASIYGTIFKIDTNGSTLTTLHSFLNSDGQYPVAGLIQGTDGSLYGTTYQGGANGYGTIFKTDTNNGLTFTVPHSFAYSDGTNTLAELIQGTDGNLYGTTYFGGANGYGTIFKTDTNGSTFIVLHSFANIPDGALSQAGLIQGTDGNLYGTTLDGGAYGDGVIFETDTNGLTFTVLLNFDGSNGGHPSTGLIQAADRNFYGTTNVGGSAGAGVIFRLCDSPTAVVSGTTSICAGSQTTIQTALTGTAPWNLIWSDGFTQGVASSPATRGVNPSATTTYSVALVSDRFCAGTSSGSAVVTVQPLPSVTIAAGGPTTFCAGGSVVLTATPSGGSGSFSAYQWYRNAVAIQGASANYAATTSGTYTATVTDSAGCSSAASNGISVTVIPLPTATVSGTAAVCKGSATTIQAALTGSAPWNLTWSDGFTQTAIAASPATRSVAPIVTTTYTVTSVSDATCTGGPFSSSAVITVELAPKATVSGDTTICANSMGATIRADLTGTPPWNLVWSDGFAQTETASPATRTVSPTVTTAYSVTAVSDAACAGGASGSATVKVNPTPSSAITAASSVCAGSSGNTASVPSAGGQATYSWSISNGTITSGAGSKSIKFSAGGPAGSSVTITITVTSAKGCTSTSTIVIPISC